MIIDWTSEFDRWLTRLEEAAENNTTANRQLDHVTAQLHTLQQLDGPPTNETASLRRVRQSRTHPVWRLSHAYDPGIAVRLIVWFPTDQSAVIVLFAADKATMGDVFYDSVGSRADAAIHTWRQT